MNKLKQYFCYFQELDETISNVLHIVEPPESTARVVYSYKDGTFIPYKNIQPFITLIELKSTLIQCESKHEYLHTGNLI